jgi:hypothetical protein
MGELYTPTHTRSHTKEKEKERERERRTCDLVSADGLVQHG